MQEEILEQLAASNFRSSAKTKDLFHKLTGIALCSEHRRQQDRLERRWTKDIETEKVRRKKEEERRRMRAERGEEEEVPESPTPIARGEPRRLPHSGTKHTRQNFNRLAARGPRIPPPVFGRKAGAKSVMGEHLDVPPVSQVFPRGTHTSTPGLARDIPERRPILGSNRREPPAPSINALIDTGRKYNSKNSSTDGSNPDLAGLATKIPKPNIAAVRRPVFSKEAYTTFGALPLTPARTPSSGVSGMREGGGGLGTDDMEEVRVLQDAILRNQEKILRDQGRIIEILVGGGGV